MVLQLVRTSTPDEFVFSETTCSEHAVRAILPQGWDWLGDKIVVREITWDRLRMLGQLAIPSFFVLIERRIDCVWQINNIYGQVFLFSRGVDCIVWKVIIVRNVWEITRSRQTLIWLYLRFLLCPLRGHLLRILSSSD